MNTIAGLISLNITIKPYDTIIIINHPFSEVDHFDPLPPPPTPTCGQHVQRAVPHHRVHHAVGAPRQWQLCTDHALIEGQAAASAPVGPGDAWGWEG